MKITGFILIVMSSAACGMCINYAKQDRIKELASFVQMLEYMQAELLCNFSSLPYIADKLILSLSGRALDFIKALGKNLNYLGELSLEEIWDKSLAGLDTHLHKPELEAIKSISNVLGKYDASKQAAIINDVKNLLLSASEKEQKELPQYRKTVLGISASAGAMLAVLLV